jgi:hypothetical protein
MVERRVGKVPRDTALFDAAECGRIAGAVRAAAGAWTPRGRSTSFYTLGIAAYLDIQHQASPRAYHLAAPRVNRYLREHFGWVYPRLQAALEVNLGAPVVYEDRMALPGFHIYAPHGASRAIEGDVHVDLQFMHVDWPAHEEVDLSRVATFTVLVEGPPSGSGLRVWPRISIAASVHDPLPAGGLPALTAGKAPTEHPYALGALVVHSGLAVHQIAPSAAQEGELRVTLQGHAVRARRGWIAYW